MVSHWFTVVNVLCTMDSVCFIKNNFSPSLLEDKHRQCCGSLLYKMLKILTPNTPCNTKHVLYFKVGKAKSTQPVIEFFYNWVYHHLQLYFIPLILTLLHFELPNLKSFGHPECNRVKQSFIKGCGTITKESWRNLHHSEEFIWFCHLKFTQYSLRGQG